MARQVNSLDELLSSGPSESQIFEGLEEIIPSSVLYSLVASTPIEPQHNQNRNPNCHPAGPSQRKPAKEQALQPCADQSAGRLHRGSPDSNIRSEIFAQSADWADNEEESTSGSLRHKAPVTQSDEQLIAELISRNEELVKEIRGAESTESNPHQRSPSRQLSPMRRSCSAPRCAHNQEVDVNPPQQEILEVSSDESIDQELLWRDALESMPSGNQPGPAHDLVGVPAEEVSGIVRRAKDEFFSWLLRVILCGSCHLPTATPIIQKL
ncbi:hypothetical protein M0R45_008913 [Rubus argutus]|uniref:Uncharacterized protein n=1 Tax=Rubus argutus TaxID=59490 RepID=A0AAW1Y4G3_RUBAR